jgi:hypothetical protein
MKHLDQIDLRLPRLHRRDILKAAAIASFGAAAPWSRPAYGAEAGASVEALDPSLLDRARTRAPRLTSSMVSSSA